MHQSTMYMYIVAMRFTSERGQSLYSQCSKLMPAHMPGVGKFGKGQQRFTKYMPVGQASSKPMG